MRKTILVTGATDGIGRATVKALAEAGNRIIIHGRDENRCKALAGELQKVNPGINPACHCADFSSLKEVKKFAEKIKESFSALDVLINNAGVFESQRKLSRDGFEYTFAVNHLSHFFLTLELMPLLNKSGAGRVVTVSSMAHSSQIDFDNLQGEKHYSGYEAYGLSKLCNILFAFELAERFENVTSNALHPGVISTKLLHAGWGMGGGPVAKGAETSVYLAVSGEVTGVTGKYFADKREESPAGICYDRGVRKKLWDISSRLVGKALQER